MRQQWTKPMSIIAALMLSVIAGVTLDAQTRYGRDRNDIVRVGGDVTVGQGDRANGDVVVVMGDTRIDGEVTGDLTVVMGTATLGPESAVYGDVSVVGGTLNRAPGAR